MSQVDANLGLSSAISPAGTPNRFAEMSTEDFIQIIFTELTNQDPLQPNDTGALLDQLNSIRNIESDLDLSRQLSALVTENQLASASNLIGKLVAGRDDALEETSGFVISALRRDDAVILELDNGARLPMDQVQQVIDPSIFAAGDGA